MDIKKWLLQAYRAYRRQKAWQNVVRTMAMIVVFCTTYALILPAITVETDTICGLTPHVHKEECYETVVLTDCTLPESQGHSHSKECYTVIETQTCLLKEAEAHTHSDACYQLEAVCGQKEKSAHVHAEACMGVKEILACTDTSAEHIHVGTCFIYEEQEIVCGQEETEGHTHSESCWVSRLNCGKEETEGHTHTEECTLVQEELSCSLEEHEAHSHTTTVLVCGFEEHQHDESCFPAPETEESTEGKPLTGDPLADVETAEDWEASFATLELTGDWSEDLIALAKTQLGYTESTQNFIYTDTDQQKGYTRYGQWAGDPYADWSASFVSFCLYYAEVEGIDPAQDCQLWLEALNAQEIYRDADAHVPVPGDLVFLDLDADEISDHVALVETVDAAEAEEAAVLHLISGDWENRVDRHKLSMDAETILGYAILPVEPEEHSADSGDTEENPDSIHSTEETESADPTETMENTEETEPAEELAVPEYIDSGEDGSYVAVSLPKDTAVPENADLTITAVTENDEQYAAMAEQVRSLVEEDIASLSLMDISFYDSEGTYLHVPDTASVTITMQDALAPGTVKVFHFVDNVPVEVETVSVNSVVAESQDDSETMQTYLTFETEGFSVFAVVEVVTSEDKYELVDGVAATAMAGEYYILNYEATAAMMAESTVNNKNQYSALTEAAVADKQNLDIYTLWTLELVSGNNYRVYTTNAQGTKQYLMGQNVVSNGAEQPNWDLGMLTLTTEESAATVFALTVNDDGAYAFAWNNGSKTRYITDLEDETLINEGAAYGFTIHSNKGTQSQLHLYKEIPDTIVPVTGLDGKQYAIVNLNTQSRQFALTSEHNADNTKLKAVPVVVKAGQDGVTYVAGEGITEWKFIATDTAGSYYIQAVDTGKYLHLVGNDTENLTTSDTQQAILVALDETDVKGQVTLAANDSKLNWIGMNANRGDIYGVWRGTDRNSRQSLCVVRPDGLYYTLNAPAGANWVNTPSVSQTYQPIGADGAQLLTVDGKNDVGVFVDNTIDQKNVRDDLRTYYNAYNNDLRAKGQLTADTFLAPGAQFRFLGWKATVEGNDYWFAENAAAFTDEDGNIHITDKNGVERILPGGTLLTGQWKKHSDVLMFFVNYGDTMLETQDNQPIVGYGTNYYTGVVAVAHIYDADGQIDSLLPAGDKIQRSKDALIQAEIVPSYDPNRSGTQIVIDAVAVHNGTSFEYQTVTNYNQTQLEAIVGEYLRKDTNSSTQVKLDNAYIEKSKINADNYKLYWYLQKEVGNDGWHIDGVLVAKTKPMEIYKTFSGLTREQATTAIGQMTFPLYLIHTEKSEDQDVDKIDDYKELRANGNEAGVFQSDGWQSATGNIYKWTLQSVQGQRYAFQETGYEITGFDDSSLISVHFTDGSIKYEYGKNATYQKPSESSDIITDYFKDETGEKGLIGGEVESVIFANFYTPTGTGMFSISKVADTAGQVRLQGAQFTLKDSDGEIVATQTTNENGAAHFSNLSAGTYTLEETAAPTGYQTISNTWTVVVTVSYDDDVTVSLQENVPEGGTSVTTFALDNTAARSVELYKKGEGIKAIPLIHNSPVNTTVTVNKYFATITSAEIIGTSTEPMSLKGKGYKIEVKDANETVQQTLTLENATPITGVANAFTWTIALPCSQNYKFVESNFAHDNYLDTAVSAKINTSDAPVTRAGDTASFDFTKSDHADTVDITNDYTNTFDLRIHKVDATNSDAPMQGVRFNIYGDFQFHKQPPAGVSSTVDYTHNGTAATAYYIGQTTETDQAGYTTFANMHLSSGSRTFLYVITEANTPAGYVELDEPIVRVVTVDGENYSNGVYTLKVENVQTELATVSVTATKQWDIPEDMTLNANQTVTLTLYKMVRNKADGSDHITDTVTVEGTVTLNASTGWTKTWTGLPYAEGNVRNEYFIAENPIDGFNLSYSTAVSNLTVGSSNVDAAKADGYELKRSVVVTNSTGFELPSTGGVGEPAIVFLGLMLMLSGGWCWLEANKKQARGRE